MARRRRGRTVRPRDAPDHRPVRLGSHFRADGQPKTAFPTQREATAAADERRRESGVDMSVYQCDLCAAWHMGTARSPDP
ncbi:MAG TPA: hypothetical protein VEH29_11415 [Acidimicrobiales bacterium]|nr:hypothetical protein [Acidimicrobiales bacterium]